MELTQEHFDQAIKGLATQDSLAQLEKTIAEIRSTQNIHGSALDTLLKNHQTKQDENIVSVDRFTRLELWAKQVGEKIGVKLDL